MIWLRIMAVSRPFWQLAIIVLYAENTPPGWREVGPAVIGAALIATNALLGTNLDNPRWVQVCRITLWAEAVIAGAGVIVMNPVWPLGPASLLLLPTIITYAWMFQRDGVQWLMALEMLGLYVLTVLWGMSGGGLAPGTPQMDQDLARLVVGLYGAVMAFGALLGFLLQLQKHEGTRLVQAMQKVEEQSKQLNRVNHRLNEYAGQVYELAAADERNRIAGQIHDTVAHRLTALLVQLQAARRILTAEQDPASVAENLQVCEALARESLDEVRTSVRAIRRPANLQGIDLLRRLVLDYASLTSMEIVYDVDGAVGELPAPVIAMLYRVLQESLTNAQRHGKATCVTVALRRLGVQVELSITDNGIGAAATVMGFGLSSMRDRVVQLGGDIHVDTKPGQGFSLRLSLPLWEGAFT